jgi:hypothetical protein
LLTDDAMGTTASAATLRAIAAPAFMRRMIKICGIALVAGLVIGLAHFTSWTSSNAVVVAPTEERTNAEAVDDLRTSFQQAAEPAAREDRAPILQQAAPAAPARIVMPAAPAAPVETPAPAAPAAPAAPVEAAMPPAAVPAAAITQAVSETVAAQSSEPVAAAPSEPVVAAPSATPSDESAPAAPKAAAKKPAAHKSASKKPASDKTAQTSAVEAPAFPIVDITTPR